MQVRLKYLILLSILIACSVYSQQDDVYLDMTLEELMDIEVVVSASKKPEDLFEAPLSTTIIRHDDIVKAGALSIPEALRLAPGMIVREETPGNFDIHIRGFDDVTRSFVLPTPINSIMLVMIDNRIVYNYFAGGTFWEALPIDINDVERIEIVRGPASALYGPNAAAGVINIITTKPTREGLHTNFDAAMGTLDTKIFRGDVSYRCNDKACFRLSGNFNLRERKEDRYFTWRDQKYVSVDSLTSLMFLGLNENGRPIELYETGDLIKYDAGQALERYGFNSFFNYQISRDSYVSINAGIQNSVSQKAYYNNFATPLSEYTSDSHQFDVRTQYKRFYGQISYNQGQHDTNVPWNRYDFKTVDATLEYDYQWKKFTFRPGFNFRKAEYGGMLIMDECWEEKYFDSFFIPDKKRKIEATAGSVLADYRPNPSIRLISGLRIDKYNVSKSFSVTYEVAATYRFNKENLGRIVFSKANRAPFMIDTYIGNCVAVPFWMESISQLGEIRFKRSDNSEFLTNRVLELGWRTKLTPRLKVDAEMFSAWLTDPMAFMIDAPVLDTTSYEYPVYAMQLNFQNTNLYFTQQIGSSVNIDYQISDKLHLNFYGMAQKTSNDYDEDDLVELVTADYMLNTGEQPTSAIIDSLVKITKEESSRSTPIFFGGFQANYSPVSGLNLNLNTYFMSQQITEGIGLDERYVKRIPATAVVNARIGYKFCENGEIYLSGRNLLGKHREYAFTDRIYSVYLMGLQVGF